MDKPSAYSFRLYLLYDPNRPQEIQTNFLVLPLRSTELSGQSGLPGSSGDLLETVRLSPACFFGSLFFGLGTHLHPATPVTNPRELM
jgi:hypothetical protein